MNILGGKEGEEGRERERGGGREKIFGKKAFGNLGVGK